MLVLIGFFLLFVSHQSCINGVAFDKNHKLAPEILNDDGGCVISFPIREEYIYGERWKRLGAFTFFSGAVLLLSAFFLRKRNTEKLTDDSIFRKDIQS